MPTDGQYDETKQALKEWQSAAEEAIRRGDSAAVPNQSPLIPEHVRAHLEEKLPRAESVYRVGVYFEEAVQMAKYPAGFVSPHPAYLAYKGEGISAIEHVQNHLFNFRCPRCRTIGRVIVLSSEWGVNMMSGDSRGTFKAKCGRCGKRFAGGFED